MAAKKRKKIVKRSAHKRTHKHKLYGMDYDFIIISGGGLVIVLLAALFLF